MKKSLSIAAAGLLALTSIGLTTQTSSAAFTTRCVGEGGAVTIPGDLVVPAGQACYLNGTVIQGNVRVQSGADLVMTGVTVSGDTVVRDDGYLEAVDSTLEGALTARQSFGNVLDGSTVAGAVTTVNDTTGTGFIIIDESHLADRVRSTGGALDLSSSTVAGQVQGIRTEYTDVYDAVIEGALQVDGNTVGSVVCDSEVYGPATWRGNQTGVQLGGDLSHGALSNCDGSNYFGGNVTVDNTSGGVWVVGNIIRGGLTGTGNDPAPVGAGNRVRGELGGQFTAMGAPTGPAVSAQRANGRVAETVTERSAEQVTGRGAEVRQDALDRSAKATQRAEAAGAAF
ncbi:hypothetical protein [Propioniciclava soli]|uniref:Right-handed parallel beta-helix repeat-containing protein n=1 Tax=Propioniciclava soli TaxID=2775081 RepID=A0ABZ3C7Q3_9ACTN|nr:hypothetical protein [Propioniciclava soli]